MLWGPASLGKTIWVRLERSCSKAFSKTRRLYITRKKFLGYIVPPRGVDRLFSNYFARDSCRSYTRDQPPGLWQDNGGIWFTRADNFTAVSLKCC